MNGGVYNAERWDPASGQWTTLAAQAVTRQYHSTALLLPDGRVLSSGGGICGTCDQVGYLAKNAEVFSPPYLFKQDGSGELATRPQITAVPATVNYGSSFQISTPNAASIQKVGLVRLGSQTHSVEMEQRYVAALVYCERRLTDGDRAANMNTAVPGVYMLFIVDTSGVPSVAQMGSTRTRRPPPPPRTTTTTSRRRRISRRACHFTSPSKRRQLHVPRQDRTWPRPPLDQDGTVARVEFFTGATKLGEDTDSAVHDSVERRGGRQVQRSRRERPTTPAQQPLATRSPITVTKKR
jgi:hypothetical protein